LICCIRWTFAFAFKIFENRFQTGTRLPIGTTKDVPDKGIEMSNEDDIFWCFIHQSIKREAMIETKSGGIWAIGE
jgi:hypothetical protein